jgi:dihydrofolate reductase
MIEIIIIAAAGKNNELGFEGKLPWHLPDDFAHFKRKTLGHPIIMGRKTFETFPKPLPQRPHIVITRDRNYSIPFPDCRVVHSLEEALDDYSKAEKLFIIGGGEIYNQSLSLANTIELTRVNASFKADTYFPELDPGCWEKEKSEIHPKDERHVYSFSFETWKRTC